MRLENSGQVVVVAPHPPLCRDLRGDEDNRNTVPASEDYSLLTTDLISSAHLNNSTSGSGNNNDASPLESQAQRIRLCSESTSVSSRDDSIGDYDGNSSSSVDIFPQGDEYQCFSQEDVTDSDFSDDGNSSKDDQKQSPRHGITNPNYPGFQSYARSFTPVPDNNGNEGEDRVNHLDSVEHFQKDFYDKPKFESRTELVQDLNIIGDASDNSEQDLNIVGGTCDSGTDNVFPEINYVISSTNHKFEFSPKETYQDSGVSSAGTTDSEFEAYESSFLVETKVFPVSGVFETTVLPDDESDVTPSPVEETKTIPFLSQICTPSEESKKENEMSTILGVRSNDLTNCVIKHSSVSTKFAKESANEKRLVEQEVMKRKRDHLVKGDVGVVPDFHPVKDDVNGVSDVSGPGRPLGADLSPTTAAKKVADPPANVPRSLEFKHSSKARGVPRNSAPFHEKKALDVGAFDVYNIETAMPHIDLDAIESHLKAAREEEKRRRNDREEIRRRLAMGTDSDEFYCGERSGKKPSLQARLQGGMNLQICFMNDTGSDSDSPSTDADAVDSVPSTLEAKRPATLQLKSSYLEERSGPRPSPSRLTLPLKKDVDLKRDKDLFACQARLQAEARQALMQAKEMARMQMEVERQKMPISPITQMVRSSLLKVGVPLPDDRRRLSRQILTEMNIAQLQVIINDLHSQIEVLNENLVEYLMSRDDLHMEQDSMLVDIEDITRYLNAKEKLLDTAPNCISNVNDKHHLGSQAKHQNSA